MHTHACPHRAAAGVCSLQQMQPPLEGTCNMPGATPAPGGSDKEGSVAPSHAEQWWKYLEQLLDEGASFTVTDHVAEMSPRAVNGAARHGDLTGTVESARSEIKSCDPRCLSGARPEVKSSRFLLHPHRDPTQRSTRSQVKSQLTALTSAAVTRWSLIHRRHWQRTQLER